LERGPWRVYPNDLPGLINAYTLASGNLYADKGYQSQKWIWKYQTNYRLSLYTGYTELSSLCAGGLQNKGLQPLVLNQKRGLQKWARSAEGLLNLI